MVLMEESVVVMMFCSLWALGLYAFYQRFFVNRRLRKQIARYAEAVLATASAPASASQQPATQSDDFKRMQQRLEVLERIAVEKEDSLTREIEELRIASR